jgi:hypothetical protein
VSTILDALRKVEEENRSGGTEARVRLFSFSTGTDIRPRQRRRKLWPLSVSLILAGFAAGVGLTYWGSHPQPSQDSQPTDTAVALRPPATGLANNSGGASAASTDTPPPPSVQAGATILPDPPLLTPSPIGDPPPRVARPRPAPVPKPKRKPPPVAAVDDSLFFDTEALFSEDFELPPLSEPLGADEIIGPNPFLPAQKDLLSAVPSEPPLAQKPQTRANTRAAPSDVSLSFLQWSQNSDQRIAFIRISGGPLTMVHEGGTVGVYTVVEINRDSVILRSGKTRFTLETPQ